MKITEILTELVYDGNVGIIELTRFFTIATPAEKQEYKQLMADGKKGDALELMQRVVGVKLKGDEFSNPTT